MNKRITTALAATMVCALTFGLAGCEGQVPQTVAPSVKDNEIIDVTVAQEKQIRGKILDVLNQANEAKSADGLAARVSGSQLEIRTAQLNIAQYTQQDVTPLATIPSDVTQVVIPTDNAWPRYIFTVTTTTEDQQAKRLLVMRQESARQNYNLWAVARLREDVSLPGFAPAKQGNVMGDANDSNLVMTPKQAVQRYADVLQNNTNSKYAGSFEDDQFRQSLVKQQEESQKGVTQNKGTQQEVFAPVVDQIAVMRSPRGGDLVVAQINSEWTRSMSEGRESLPGSPNEDALFKMTNQKATSSLKATYVNVVAIFVPLAGSDQKVTVVAGDRQAVKVEAQ